MLTIYTSLTIPPDGPYLRTVLICKRTCGKQGTSRGGATAQRAEKLVAQRGWDWLEDHTAVPVPTLYSLHLHIHSGLSASRLWEDRGLTILYRQHPLLWTSTEQLL